MPKTVRQLKQEISILKPKVCKPFKNMRKSELEAYLAKLHNEVGRQPPKGAPQEEEKKQAKKKSAYPKSKPPPIPKSKAPPIPKSKAPPIPKAKAIKVKIVKKKKKGPPLPPKVKKSNVPLKEFKEQKEQKEEPLLKPVASIEQLEKIQKIADLTPPPKGEATPEGKADLTPEQDKMVRAFLKLAFEFGTAFDKVTIYSSIDDDDDLEDSREQAGNLHKRAMALNEKIGKLVGKIKASGVDLDKVVQENKASMHTLKIYLTARNGLNKNLHGRMKQIVDKIDK